MTASGLGSSVPRAQALLAAGLEAQWKSHGLRQPMSTFGGTPRTSHRQQTPGPPVDGSPMGPVQWMQRSASRGAAASS